MTLHVLMTLATSALLATAPLPTAATSSGHPVVFPAGSSPYGQTYAEWSADWWTWLMEHPMPGHPAIDSPQFDVTSGQSGNVWFLSTVLDLGAAVPRTRTITVPRGKALFVGLLNAETSSQEGTPDEPTQRATSNFIADHIVARTCTIDGVKVDLTEYRFESPQFEFTAPDPWIFGPGGAGLAGTSVADGYYVMVKPLSVGKHVLRATGRFHFDAFEIGNPVPIDLSLDMTYDITVQ